MDDINIDEVNQLAETTAGSGEGNKTAEDGKTEAAEADAVEKSIDGVPIDESVVLDITDDMYCGCLSSDLISEFVCMLCCGIVYEPVKCTRCANMVCKKCVNGKKMLEGN